MSLVDLREIEIENHPAMIHIHGQDEVRIHVALVMIDHQIGIMPKIPSAITPPGRRRGRIFRSRHHRTGLQAIAVFVLNGVLLVIQDAVQAFMQMRNVVAPIQVIVDENFPVAMNVIHSAIEVMQLAQSQRRHAFHQSA